MNPIAIQTQSLTRDFKTVRAVDDLTLDVPAGKVFGSLGPTGSGKTTTIRLLLGLLEPTQGQAKVLGFDTRSEAARIRAQCGALLEHNGLYERLSAETNLEFYGRIWHIPSTERKNRIQELLTHLDLWERRKEITGNWSRGMKQKLAFARTLLHKPALVFLDEPTAGLDPLAAASLREDLSAMAKREGVTIFLTTHNLAEAEKLCDQVGVIRQGKLVAVGSPETLRGQGSIPRVRITGRNFSDRLLASLRSRSEVKDVGLDAGILTVELKQDGSLTPLVNLMVQEGAEIEEVNRMKASLEDVFLTLMEEEK